MQKLENENEADIISAQGITIRMRSGVYHVEARKTVTSTNTVLRELAAKGAQEGYVLVAEEQTEGKGRLGRSFHSPAGHGAYFSVLLRPTLSAIETTLVTSAAAVAAARAIEAVFEVSVGIKWVNDLTISGKKVCGILTEASFDAESGTVSSCVLGIGINVTIPENGFPEELKNTAATVADRHIAREGERCRLIAATLDSFHELYKDISARAFLDEYRARSTVIGHDILVLSGGAAKPARALEIDDNCRLVVKYDDGTTVTLDSGEVSVRNIK